ncbi:Ribosomal RNA small subunit methyltransferase F [Candidatus Lokiarchaeum ossiferum]|uniref:Ribosomal RNA small subunit methyltransferase F n=1 Tax=Candidatus Lokiarchaeum ossiferum TaxID=2951803 RepID=A0ABY6HV34_9ARCH|nr:Ribosomal RNA small subunit methyltransferase F [Candidatus Lokiarchaeum sp. B-35]
MTQLSESDKIRQLAEDYAYSPFMMEQIMINFPDDYMGVIRAFNKPDVDTIRVNTLKSNPQEVKTLLEAKGFHLRPTKWVDYAFHVDSSDAQYRLGATHEYLKGKYYIQSLASMIPVHFLFPQPGDNILDMCAAPGSKTTQIAQIMEQKGTLVAVDAKPSRLRALTSNVKRCGIKNCIIFPFDSTQLNSNNLASFVPNKILLDAPCSGSGIIRGDPNLKKVKNDKDIKRLSQIQKRLLKTGLDLLPSGGYLMYSTCSFHYQENEQVVSETISQRKDIDIIEPFEDIGMPGHEHIGDMEFGYDLIKSRRLYPNLHDTDAFFLCLMKKK